MTLSKSMTPSKAPLPNEVVQRHADLLFLWRVITFERRAREGVAERRERCANDPQPARVGACDQLLVSLDDRLGGRLWVMERQAAAGPTKVVDAHHEDDRVGFRLTEDVGIEARERIGSHPVGQNLRTRYALVQDRDRRAADLCEPLGQTVGHRSLPSTVEPSPSVIESPNVMTARAPAGASTRISLRKTRCVIFNRL